MKIGFITCQDYPSLSADDQFLRQYLQSKNLEIDPLVWDNSTIEWEKYDLLILRSTWDYFLKTELFIKWLEFIKSKNLYLLNPIDTVSWNMNKKYFIDLQNQGIPIPAFEYCLQNNIYDLQQILVNHGWGKAVIKPTISGGSYQTWIAEIENAYMHVEKFTEMLRNGDVIIQEFRNEIISQGEISLLYFNKKFSHAIIKNVKPGDFRVQSQYGGTVTDYHPDNSLLYQAQKLIDSIQGPLLYARVDGILVNQTQFYLMELELIEPYLFMEQSNANCDNFYQALSSLTVTN